MSLLQFRNNAGETLEHGDVVILSQQQPSFGAEAGMPVVEVDLSRRAYDSSVCGIVYDLYTEHQPDAGVEQDAGNASEPKGSGRGRRKPGIERGSSQRFTLAELEKLDRTQIAAGQIGHIITSGVMVCCKIDADVASVKIGDLLTTGDTKGYAQKVTDPAKAVGAVLGKALASMKKGKGTIPVLVLLA